MTQQLQSPNYISGSACLEIGDRKSAGCYGKTIRQGTRRKNKLKERCLKSRLQRLVDEEEGYRKHYVRWQIG